MKNLTKLSYRNIKKYVVTVTEADMLAEIMLWSSSEPFYGLCGLHVVEASDYLADLVKLNKIRQCKKRCEVETKEY